GLYERSKVKDQTPVSRRHDEARDVRDRHDLRAGEAARDARSEEGAGDRREHPPGRPAKPDSGAAGRRTFRPSGRAASFGGVQATRRGNHRRICRAGPPALTAWKRYRCMAALVPVLRAADGTATTHIQSARISQLARADEAATLSRCSPARRTLQLRQSFF